MSPYRRAAPPPQQPVDAPREVHVDAALFEPRTPPWLAPFVIFAFGTCATLAVTPGALATGMAMTAGCTLMSLAAPLARWRRRRKSGRDRPRA